MSAIDPTVNVEIWKAISDCPTADVSNLGRVRSYAVRGNGVLGRRAAIPKILTPVMGRGYLRVNLRRDGARRLYAVHRLVLEAFIGPAPEGIEGHHFDGDQTNNALSNLSWGTPKENWEGRRRRGTDSRRYKLMPEDVERAREVAKARIAERARNAVKYEPLVAVPSSPVEYRLIPSLDDCRVGSDGTAWSCRIKGHATGRGPWKLLSTQMLWSGYLYVTFRNKMRYIHLLVLEAFKGPRPEGMQARHLNGVRTDNRPENLEWGTCKENHADKRIHGTAPIGENSPSAIIDEETVELIRELSATYKATANNIGRMLGISRRHAARVINRERWTHI